MDSTALVTVTEGALVVVSDQPYRVWLSESCFTCPGGAQLPDEQWLDERLFGSIAIRRGYTNKEQVTEGLDRQKDDLKGMKIGDILVHLGHMKQGEVGEVVDAQKAQETFGAIAVRKDFASPAQVGTALAKQLSEGAYQKIGEILVSEGVMTSDQVEQITAEQIRRFFLAL